MLEIVIPLHLLHRHNTSACSLHKLHQPFQNNQNILSVSQRIDKERLFDLC